MKIYGSIPPEGRDMYPEAQKIDKKKSVKSSGSAEGAEKGDRVDISGRAGEAARYKNEISQLPDMRTEKMQAIEKAIAEGSYRVDPDKIAGKIIEELA